MYKIGDFSQMGQVSVRMLRHYDKLGLLNPAHTDEWTGYRYYTLDQLPRLHRILALRDLGLSLEQVGDLLDEPQTDDYLYELLQTKRRALEQQLAEEQARLDRVAARLHQIERVHEPVPYDVALKELPAQRIIAIREVVPHLLQTGAARDRILRHLYATLDAYHIIPGVEMAIYHLQAYTAENIDMSLAVEVAPDVELPSAESTLHLYSLAPAPLAASVVHNGDMRDLSDVAANLFRWLGMNGYAGAGDSRELHLFGRELDWCANNFVDNVVVEFLIPIEKL